MDMAVRLLSGKASPIRTSECPLRLLYLAHQFYPEYRNGTEKFVLQLAQSMQSRGHQVQVVTYRTGGLRRWQRWRQWLGVNFWQQRDTYAGVPVLAVRHSRRPPAYHQQVDDEAERTFARRFLQKWRPDLIHVGHTMRMSGFVWAAHDLGIPTVLTLTDYWLICPKALLVNSRGALCDGPVQGLACRSDCPDLSPDFVSRRLALAENLVRQAACVVAPSRHLAQVFQREWPWLALQVVPHGVLPWAHNSRRYARDDGLVFAYAGSLTWHKGVHTLIEAFRGVQAGTARLTIYGAGPDEAALRGLADDDPRIQFGGVYTEQDASQVFGTTDVLVAPSEWAENRPFVVHEALASGVPVIISAVGGMVDAVADGITGFVTPPGDVAALRAVLQRLAEAPEQLNQLKDRIAMLAIPTPAMEADAYAAIYRTVRGQHDATVL
jgi:glycosyltransferase involved in cell wall biosynthesis